MLDQPGLALRISTALLVLSGYFALASVRGYSALILVPPIIAILCGPFGERLDAASPLYRRLSLGISIACFLALPVLGVSLGLLATVLLLVVYIQLYLLVHRKNERYYYYVFLMAFFIMLAACVQAPEAIIGVVFALFIVSAVWAFTALRVAAESAQAPLRTPPDLHALRLGAWRPIVPQRGFGTAFGPAILVLSLAALGCTALFFYFAPRVEAGFLGRADINITRTGLSQTVDLTSGAYVQEDQTAVMHVRFPDAPGGAPGIGPLYWRVSTLNNYRGSAWTRRQLREHGMPNIRDFFDAGLDRFLRVAQPELARSRISQRSLIVRQEIFMENVPPQGLPCLDLVQRVDVRGRTRETRLSWDAERDFSVLLATSGPRQLAYEVWSEVFQYTPEELRAVPQDFSAMDPADFALLTDHELLPETVALARQIAGDAPSLYDKVMAVQSYLSSARYAYTLDLPIMPTEHVIDAFINEVRQGHCEYFSSAMALMLRSLGIPARVVTGFRGGEFNEGDQSYTIRASMAHLWVEVLFPGLGWVRFDTSPMNADVRIGTFASIAQYLSTLRLRASMWWYAEIIGFDRGLQIERLRNFSLGLINTFTGATSAPATDLTQRAPTRLPLGYLLLASLVATGGAWLIFRRTQDNTAILLTSDQARAARLYRRCCRLLERHGISCAGKTAEEILHAAREHPAVDREKLRMLLDAYNEMRFGLRPCTPARKQEFLAGLRMLMHPQR
jgi:hypothetical protein